MTTPWWQTAVFYHVYVRSFGDSNGDGLGDIPGLLERIEYMSELGVDAVWLSPFYPSPQADFGYDVSDYRDVDPDYGTLDDLARFRDALHERGMKLILDLVPSHTSDQHAWFEDALTSREAEHRDWYIWRDPAPDGGPPNNWCSIFGGPAWSLHEPTGQYFLHSFLAAQPDLNWRNPAVEEGMHDIMRFWLDWGADGFRVDAIGQVFKDEELRSNPMDENYAVPAGDSAYDPFAAQQHVYDTMQEEVFDVVGRMRALVDEYEDRVLIGETAVDWENYKKFVGPERFQLAFCFYPLKARSLAAVRDTFESLYETVEGLAWPTLVLGNHDIDRFPSRIASDWRADDAATKAGLAALLLSRGSPFVYYGDEIGMPNGVIPDAALQDPVGVFERDRGHRIFFGQGFESYGRDPERTPMQWTGGANAGFTTGEPWLPVADGRNVEDQANDEGSVLRWSRALLEARREHPPLSAGDHEKLPAPESVWAFERTLGVSLRVAINLDGRAATLEGSRGTVLLGTHRAAGDEFDGELAPFEVVVSRA